MKKVLSLLMVLTMVVPLFSTTRVYADDNTVVVDGVTFSKNMKILIKYPADKMDESYTIPDTVEYINQNAFSYCDNLKNVYILEGVTSIGKEAFSWCDSLESISIPGTVTNMQSAFCDCDNLKDVDIADGVKNIDNAFMRCKSLEKIYLPNSINSMEGAFYGCEKLKEVVLPANITSLDHSFRGCESLTGITIPNSVTDIDGAFGKCINLVDIELPPNISTMGAAFNGCNSLTEITIPDGVSEISGATGTFVNCTSLKKIYIPASVKFIEVDQFDGCTSLTDIYYGATEIEWNSIKIGTGNEFLQTANIHFTEPDKSEIKVTLYGKKLSFDQPPVIENGRTLVPLRAIFEALNAEVAWDGETQTVRAIRYGTYIELQIGSNEIKVNNEIKILDVPAKTINDRTMVPARAIAEAFGCNVSWDAENNAVIIN